MSDTPAWASHAAASLAGLFLGALVARAALHGFDPEALLRLAEGFVFTGLGAFGVLLTHGEIL